MPAKGCCACSQGNPENVCHQLSPYTHSLCSDVPWGQFHLLSLLRWARKETRMKQSPSSSASTTGPCILGWGQSLPLCSHKRAQESLLWVQTLPCAACEPLSFLQLQQLCSVPARSRAHLFHWNKQAHRQRGTLIPLPPRTFNRTS